MARDAVGSLRWVVSPERVPIVPEKNRPMAHPLVDQLRFAPVASCQPKVRPAILPAGANQFLTSLELLGAQAVVALVGQ